EDRERSHGDQGQSEEEGAGDHSSSSEHEKFNVTTLERPKAGSREARAPNLLLRSSMVSSGCGEGVSMAANAMTAAATAAAAPTQKPRWRRSGITSASDSGTSPAGSSRTGNDLMAARTRCVSSSSTAH